MWLHSVKVAQLLRSAACLNTNQSRSYLNHLVTPLLFTALTNATEIVRFAIRNAMKIKKNSMSKLLLSPYVSKTLYADQNEGIVK